MHAVEARSLSRLFKARGGTITALNKVNLELNYGEVMGLLGANGAGKTTFVKILATLLLPSEGYVNVYGFDVVRNAKQVRKVINLVSGGETPGYGILTVRENLWFLDRKSTRLNSSHIQKSRMPSSA